MLGWDDAAIAAIMFGSWAYHRWFETPAPQKLTVTEWHLPTTQAGAPIPLLYGRQRVQKPILAWNSTPGAVTGATFGAPNAAWVYGMNMLYALGIYFDGGAADVSILNMWADDLLMQASGPGWAELDGNRTFNSGTGEWDHLDVGTATGIDGSTIVYGQAEFMNGNATQVLVDGSGNAQSNAGSEMKNAGVDTAQIPGYRNMATVFLWLGTGRTLDRFAVGGSPQVPGFSWEVQSLPSSWLGPNQQVAVLDGDLTVDQGDANPIDVLYDILTGTRGKLGLSTSRIDTASFAAAAKTLDAEGNGFSRAWDQGQTAGDMIGEIMRQIDGVPREDPSTGLISVKLIRNDYTVSALPVVSPANCTELQNFTAGGWTSIPNKIRINFSNRADSYRDGSQTAQNQANAVGQDGETREMVISMPGVCSPNNAATIAARELAANSRPIIKCSAIVDRTFFQTLPGDCVVLNWPEFGIAGIVMRVANVNRNTIKDGKIQLDLMQDYYYVWRHTVAGGRAGVSFPASGGGLAH